MDKLKFVSKQMDLISVPYEFGQWSSAATYPYYVGEQASPETFPAEDGSEESTIIVTGFHRGKLIDLERDKNKIKSHFNPWTGLISKTDSGSFFLYSHG